MNGAERLCRVLERLGVQTVFGLPGSQNVALFEALRTSRLRTVVATHELAASFMANGHARASGRPGVLLTIPGPGFTYALTGIAEAFLDSVPVLYILGKPATAPGRRFQLQALDQKAILAPMVKRIFEVESARELEKSLVEAYALCQTGEPGPVVVQVSPAVSTEVPEAEPLVTPAAPPETPPTEEIRTRLEQARRPLFYVGQGAFAASGELRALVEALKVPVVTTTSGRGVLPEDHPWVIPFDRGSSEVLNELVGSADLILALGCKFSHNGAHGFRLRLPADRLIHVDASKDVLGANYDAATTLVADVPRLIRTLRDGQKARGAPPRSEWTESEIAGWRERAFQRYRNAWEPKVRGLDPPTIETFFSVLRAAMPPESHLVVDSGLHQMLARRHYRVLCPRGFLLPTDLQAMGFALPAAIGARLADPDRPVVALMGDGGFAMSGLELLTAVREHVNLTVIVFNDGHYGLIRKQQMGSHGHAYGTDLFNPDFRDFTESVGARYERLERNAQDCLERAIRGPGITVVEVLLRDRGRQRFRRARSVASRLKHLLQSAAGKA